MVAGGEAEVFEVFGGKQELVHERGDCGERGGRAGFGTQPSTWVGLVVFGLLYAPVDLVLSAAMQAFSRKNEFEADAYAAQTTRTPENLVTALKRISKESLANLTPHPLYVALHHSHPPLLRRIEALRESAPAG